MSLVGRRNQHALVSGESPRLADIEKAFDLFIDPANRLDVSVLIDRSGDRDRLLDGHICQRREQRIQFGGRGTVPLHGSVALLEDNAGGQ
jgi:hypothetical protein